MIVLDTHVLLWMDRDDAALGPTSRALIERAWRAGDEIAVSAVSFWEYAMLAQRERVVLPRPVETWRADILGEGVVEISLDGRIALLATTLDGLPRDPAGRLIAASALHRGAMLMTADEKLLEWRSGLARQDGRQ